MIMVIIIKEKMEMRGRVQKADTEETSPNKKKRRKKRTYTKEGKMKCGWTPEELIKILTKIIKKNPNITYLEVRTHEISFNCEYSKEDLIGKKKSPKPENPSQRDPSKKRKGELSIASI